MVVFFLALCSGVLFHHAVQTGSAAGWIGSVACFVVGLAIILKQEMSE